MTPADIVLRDANRATLASISTAFMIQAPLCPTVGSGLRGGHPGKAILINTTIGANAIALMFNFLSHIPHAVSHVVHDGRHS